MVDATGGRKISRRMVSERASQRAFFSVSVLLFAASAAVTIVWCGSMSEMSEMEMPGGWTMSMAWMRMPSQTWPGAAASFLGMWVVMMLAMMLPSLVPMLSRYRQAVGGPGETRLGRLTALAGAGYFFAWTVFGMAVFPLGAALAALEMQQPALARAVPIAAGVVVLIAGALQFTAWKTRHLAYCREAPGRGRTLPADAGTAWRHGLRLGLHCSQCCAGLMAILLVVGVMDLRAMAVVAAAITVERLAPAGERVARAMGAVIVVAGLFLIARSAGLGSCSRVVHLTQKTHGDKTFNLLAGVARLRKSSPRNPRTSPVLFLQPILHTSRLWLGSCSGPTAGLM
jgi:predicted metal-binding membrane protein